MFYTCILRSIEHPAQRYIGHTAEVRAERFAEQFALVAVDGEGRAHGGLAYHWENAPRHVFVDYFYLDDTLRIFSRYASNLSSGTSFPSFSG